MRRHFFFFLELKRVETGVRGLVAHQAHEPLRRFAFDFEHQLALKFTQPLMRQEKRNENCRDADRHEPFVADVAGRMEDQSFLRQLAVKLLNERLKLRSLQLEAELGDFALQQLIVAEIGPVGGFHAASVPCGSSDRQANVSGKSSSAKLEKLSLRRRCASDAKLLQPGVCRDN